MELSSQNSINSAEENQHSLVLICQYDFKETNLGFVMLVFTLIFALFTKAE